jgi:hypothetical protein
VGVQLGRFFQSKQGSSGFVLQLLLKYGGQFVVMLQSTENKSEGNIIFYVALDHSCLPSNVIKGV